jgi:hypothetical protein
VFITNISSFFIYFKTVNQDYIKKSDILEKKSLKTISSVFKYNELFHLLMLIF